MSSNFNAILAVLGAIAAGDEKLLHFTAESIFIRKVPSKPDRIGYWYYELAVRSPNGKGFVIYIRLNDSNEFEGVHIPVHEVVQDWINALRQDIRPVDMNMLLLAADNYYMSHASRQALLTSG